MRTAAAELRNRNASRTTQRVQQEIVEHLDTLIESLSQAGSSENANRSPSKKPGSEAGESPGDDPGRSTSGAKVTGTPAEKEDADGENQSTGDLLIQVWGQLPQHLQEQIQSPTREEFLPQYRQLIVEYYRRLAEVDDDVNGLSDGTQ
jgi:hypothetical protein